jgi:hypothetical protein
LDHDIILNILMISIYIIIIIIICLPHPSSSSRHQEISRRLAQQQQQRELQQFQVRTTLCLYAWHDCAQKDISDRFAQAASGPFEQADNPVCVCRWISEAHGLQAASIHVRRPQVRLVD